MTRVLFVCTANICRSPLAEGMLRAALVAHGANARYAVDSAGTQALIGQPPAPHSIAVAAQYSADISTHVARAFVPEDFARFEYIIAMDYGHLDWLQCMRPSHFRGSLSLLPAANALGTLEIGDPYGGTRKDYERTGRLLATGIALLLTTQFADLTAAGA